MNRLNLLYKLDGLLADCKKCKRPYGAPDIKCAGCEIYPQIREIGNRLGRKEEMARKSSVSIELEDIIPLIKSGLSTSAMADELGVSTKDISNFKYRFKDKINDLLTNVQPNVTEKKPSVSKTTKDDKTDEHERLISSLRNDLKEAHAQCDEKDELLQSFKKTIEKYEQVNAACEDVENEISSLREEKDKLQNEYNKLVTNQYHKDYQVENQKTIIENLKKTLERYEDENKAFRALVRLWV
jgi:chromosome segregation ATPase